ncbi:MAG TPA: hypothetical protein VND64_13615 [Pirellulales bacterium]|nr:hypothetical protein [Pirellulales bacterium]
MTKSRATAALVTRADIFDGSGTYEVVEAVKHYLSLARPSTSPTVAPTFDYRAAFEVLAQERIRLKFGAVENTLAVATFDPESEGRSRFIDALARMGILVEAVDFRRADVTLPLVGDSDRRHITSLAPNIAYALGLLAGRPSAEVVVVTRSFELLDPLNDFVRRGGKAAIAFFRRFLDGRFGLAGLFDGESDVKFIDLDPHSERLLGYDVRDIGSIRSPRTEGISGL